MRRLALLYLLLSAALTGLLYLLFAARGADASALAVEALFAWLAVFVPPLVLVERALALARAILRAPRGH